MNRKNFDDMDALELEEYIRGRINTLVGNPDYKLCYNRKRSDRLFALIVNMQRAVNACTDLGVFPSKKWLPEISHVSKIDFQNGKFIFGFLNEQLLGDPDVIRLQYDPGLLDQLKLQIKILIHYLEELVPLTPYQVIADRALRIKVCIDEMIRRGHRPEGPLLSKDFGHLRFDDFKNYRVIPGLDLERYF